MKLPLIALTGNYDRQTGQQLLSMAYVRAVADNGGCPVVLPPITPDDDIVDTLLDGVDAVLFTGGADFTEALLGEPLSPAAGSLNPERDAYEIVLMRRAMARQMPVLGICRGAQLMALACGGKLFQDLPSEYGQKPSSLSVPSPSAPLLAHSQEAPRDQATHEVKVLPDTRLSAILQEEQLQVNSFHHQAIRELYRFPADRPAELSPDFPLLRASAFSPDGVVEAVESAEGKPFLAVQWHPECLTATQPVMNRLFRWLTDEAALYRRTRRLHDRALCFDAHTDVPMFYGGDYDLCHGGSIERGKIDFTARGEEQLTVVSSRVNLDKMKNGAWDSIVAAAYIRQLSRDDAGLNAAFLQADRLIDETLRQTALYADRAGIARTPADARRLKAEGKQAVFLGIENGYALGRDLSKADYFADKGIVYLTLCHNGHNDICDSASAQDHPEHGGLSPFGRAVVAALNRRGVMVDLSHASEKTFWDTLACSKAPVICSHSSVKALCGHRRNLSDEQIKALAAQGGLMGICLYRGFLVNGGNASLDDVVAHIHYVRQLVGIDYVGIGSDFEGGGGVKGCNDSSELFNLTRRLLSDGYTEAETEKVMGGNFLRVMAQVQKAEG